MRLAVASGKGGTGKTTIATSLALSLQNGPVLVLDCDVEAPNAHLYLDPAFEHRQEVGILLPVVDEDRCSRCGRCTEVCQFNAIAVMNDETLVFSELCHGCGSCALVCPEQALGEELDVLGLLEAGPTARGPYLAQGRMDIGAMLAVPIIRQLKRWRWTDQAPTRQTVVLDAPPGTSCPVVETVRGADFALLVTEPTPFGLHDLRLMVEVVQELGIPGGVILNRDGIGDTAVDQYCAEAGLPLLMRIPLERQRAEGIAQGEPLVSIRPQYVERFRQMVDRIGAAMQEGTS